MAVLVSPQLFQVLETGSAKSGVGRKNKVGQRLSPFKANRQRMYVCHAPPRDTIPPRGSAKLLHTTAKGFVRSRQSGNYYFGNSLTSHNPAHEPAPKSDNRGISNPRLGRCLPRILAIPHALEISGHLGLPHLSIRGPHMVERARYITAW